MSLLTIPLDEINFESDGLPNDLSQTIPINELEDSLGVYPFSKSENKTKRKNGKNQKFDIIKDKRKEDRDNIGKKIKSSFHKAIRKIINTKLKKIGSKYLFDSFPANFLSDISKKTNYEVMDLTYEQLFDYAYNKYKNIVGKDYILKKKEVAKKKYSKNIEILKYLNANSKISQESGWDIIKNMKYIDLLKAYFNSKEFEQNIEELSKKETTAYTKSYKYFSSTYVDFFLNYQTVKENNIKNDNNITNCHTLDTTNLASIFTSIFDNEENEEENSFYGLLNFDNEFSKTNSLFSDEYFLLKENWNN